MKKFLAICLLLCSTCCFAKKSEHQEIIHLNQATLEELLTLDGIGQKKAESILQYRKDHQHFDQIEELEKIQGIGPKLIQKNLLRLAL